MHIPEGKTMNDKEDSEYKDISSRSCRGYQKNAKSMRDKQGQTFKVIGSIYYPNKPLRIKSKNKRSSQDPCTKDNNGHERDCSKSESIITLSVS